MKRETTLPIIALMSLVLLTSCAAGNSDSGLSVPVYPKEKQKKAADEMQGNYCPVLNEFMIDYSVLRKQTRV